MGSVDYAVLIAGLIKPLVTHPEAVVVNVVSVEDNNIKVVALVHQDDLGRVIGKKGRVAATQPFLLMNLREQPLLHLPPPLKLLPHRYMQTG